MECILDMNLVKFIAMEVPILIMSITEKDNMLKIYIWN